MYKLTVREDGWQWRAAALIKELGDAAVVVAADVADKLKNATAQYAAQSYSGIELEIDTLMKGWIDRIGGSVNYDMMGVGGSRAGTDAGGRLIRSSFTPLHLAIRRCAVKLEPTGNIIRARTCAPIDINNVTTFKYKRADGTRHTAIPFNRHYVESVEGLANPTWFVTPRPGNKGHTLSPEPGVLARSSMKQVAPIRMFLYTLDTRRSEMITLVRRYMKSAARAVSGHRGGGGITPAPSVGTVDLGATFVPGGAE